MNLCFVARLMINYINSCLCSCYILYRRRQRSCYAAARSWIDGGSRPEILQLAAAKTEAGPGAAHMEIRAGRRRHGGRVSMDGETETT